MSEFRRILSNCCIAGSFALSITATVVHARASVAQFYKGKTISVVIGAAAGGGYDAYGRLVAQFIGRHIPGDPDVVAQNMPGAGSISAAAYVANVASKDGTAIAGLHPIAITEPLLGKKKSIGYDPRKLFYLGSANSDSNLCVVRSDSGIRSFADLEKKVGVFGASAQTSSTFQSAAFLKHILGAKIKLISGYGGTRQIMLALQRKEIDGLCGLGWSSMLHEVPDWRKTLRPIIQESVEGFGPLNALKVPVASSFAKTSLQRQAMQLYYSQEYYGRPFMIAPQTPPERRLALRHAFMESLRDPALLAAAKTRGLDIAPISGKKLQAIIKGVYATPQSVISEVQKAIGGS